jgi:hypothetical protein
MASRVDYKIALLTFKAVASKQPEYLSELVHLMFLPGSYDPAAESYCRPVMARLFSQPVLSFVPHQQTSGTNLYYAS